MSNAVEVALLACLLGVAIQDFRERKIYWIFIPIILLASFWKGVLDIGFVQTAYFVLFNAFYFLSQLLLLFIYFAVKNRRWTNIINQSLGVGDVLFILSISPVFSPLYFIVFYFTGLVITIIIYLTITGKGLNSPIPLAGILSICLFFILVLQNIITGFSTYGDERLIQLFYHGRF